MAVELASGLDSMGFAATVWAICWCIVRCREIAARHPKETDDG